MISVRGVLVCSVAVLAMAGCSSASDAGSASATASAASPSPSASTFLLTGQLAIEAYDGWESLSGKGSTCYGVGGYDDLKVGSKIVVTDKAGTILATDSVQSALAGKYDCTLSFRMMVPDGEPFYQVSVGDRDPYVADADEAKTGLKLTIG